MAHDHIFDCDDPEWLVFDANGLNAYGYSRLYAETYIETRDALIMDEQEHDEVDALADCAASAAADAVAEVMALGRAAA